MAGNGLIDEAASRKKGFKNAFILLALQVIITLSSFSANHFVVRFMSKEDYGFITINIIFLLTLINFFLKDAMRKFVQKRYDIDPKKIETLIKLNGESEDKLRKRSAINLGWISVGFTLLAASIIMVGLYIYYGVNWNSAEAIASYIYTLCCMVDSLSEPLNFKYLVDNDFKNRASSESTGFFIRSLLIIYLAYKNYGTLSFAYGQIVFISISSFMFFTISYLRERKNPLFKFRDFFPKKIKGENGEDFYMFTEMKKELLSFSLLSSLKLILQEGEKAFIVFAETLSGDIKGEYSLITNFASILPRFLFAPVDESAFNIFGKSENPQEDTKFLCQATRLLTTVVFLAVSLSYYLSNVTIKILYSDRWNSENVRPLLVAYCIFLIFCAINGLSEAYVQAKAKSNELYNITFMLIINSVLYLGACYALKRYSAIGLIVANMINMLFRIVVSFTFIHAKHPKQFASIVIGCLPHWSSWVLLLPINAIMYILKAMYGEQSYQILIGGCAIAGIWMLLLVKDNYSMIFHKKDKKAE